MPPFRLRRIGPEQAVPNRQIESVIGIVLAPQHGMMHPVHVWRHDDEAQNPIERARQRQIGVVEHSATIEDDLEQEHGEGRRSYHEHHHDLPQHRKPNLDRMKSDRRGDVDIAVGVVNLVQAPEDGHFVRDEMLRPDGEIEREQRDHEFEPARPRDLVEEPDPVSFGIEPGSDRGDRDGQHRQQTEQERIHHTDAEIGDPTP